MSLDESTPSLDLIRWTFTVNPEHRTTIENYLNDLGLDVTVRDDAQFVVCWEEPDDTVDEVVGEIWALNGAPFDVAQEEFHRLSLNVLQQADEEVSEAA